MMIISWKNGRIILVAFLLTLCQSLASYAVFRNFSITLNEKISLIENQLNEIRNATQPPPPASSMYTVYGPNGSKHVFVSASVSVSIGVRVSAEIERTYVLTLGFLEDLGKIVDLMNDASIVTAVTSCVVCIALIISGLRKIPKPLIPSL
jgi:hypothetical protein